MKRQRVNEEELPSTSKIPAPRRVSSAAEAENIDEKVSLILCCMIYYGLDAELFLPV